MHGAVPPLPEYVYMAWRFISNVYGFMAWYLVKHKDNFTFTLPNGNRVGRCVLDSSGSGQGSVAGSCEHSNKPSGFTKGREFFDYLPTYLPTYRSIYLVSQSVSQSVSQLVS
jgi:hypothetical protein